MFPWTRHKKVRAQPLSGKKEKREKFYEIRKNAHMYNHLNYDFFFFFDKVFNLFICILYLFFIYIYIYIYSFEFKSVQLENKKTKKSKSANISTRGPTRCKKQKSVLYSLFTNKNKLVVNFNKLEVKKKSYKSFSVYFFSLFIIIILPFNKTEKLRNNIV